MKQIKDWAYNNLKGDPILWLIIILSSLFSILVVYSATGSLAYRIMEGNTEYYLVKHSVLVMISLSAIWIIHKIDYQYFAKVSKLILWLCVPLLLFTWLFGSNINYASRWLNVPVINYGFQPSDLAKLSLIVTLANMLSKRQYEIKDSQKTIIPMLFWIGLICGLIGLTNISSSILLAITCMLILFIGRVPFKYIFQLTTIIIVFGSIAFVIGQRGQTAINRVDEFINNDTPHQAEQAYIAIASGGMFGNGPGQSEQRNFLPHAYSDFIYAIIIEEYGMIGGLIVLSLFMALLYRGIKISMDTDKSYGGLLSIGLSFMIVIQALINMSVTVGLLPVTGLPLPFISMGGTSQILLGIAMGMILSVSRENNSLESKTNNVYRNVA